jgi:tetratricopeptide (TPR) repeat protein
MRLAVYILISLMVVSVALVSATCVLTSRLAPEPARPAFRRWLAVWSLKGLIVPAAIWILLNLGLSWDLQPLMPVVQAGRITGSWEAPFMKIAGLGVFIVSSYWAAATLLWVLAHASRGLKGEQKENFIGLCLTAGLGMAVVALLLLLLGGSFTLGLAVAAMLAPVAGYAPGILMTKKLPPMYARAIAKMKFGKYTEAEWELIQQLEQAEDDFQGWMMMAELYAVHFKDVGEAEQTILDICDNPKVTKSQISIALHKLADWHLSIGEDPDAARRALQMVQDRCKGMHLARMAQLRLQQIPATRSELREQKTAEPIPLPALGDTLEEDGAESEQDLKKAQEAAKSCIERLEQDPNNTHARERLARALAEHLGRPDDGIEQLSLLLDMPEQPNSKRAEWLSLQAAWQLKYKNDRDKGRELLKRLVREFPETAQAFAAEQRLRHFERHGR